LLVQNRVQCKHSLKKKNVLDEDCCDICRAAAEDADHIIAKCNFAKNFWAHLGWDAERLPLAAELWTTKPQAGFPSQALPTMLLLCCWQLWKHQHDVVFRSAPLYLPGPLQSCKTETYCGATASLLLYTM
ncbi:hypothetical protein BAE44_0010324, partial [Dichanthelium oligosanthes]